MGSKREAYTFGTGILLLVMFFLFLLFIGAVPIPSNQVLGVLAGNQIDSPYVRTIVMETRLPMAIAAASSGATLSVAGLMMQTLFHNPLAGPSVLGISSGSSLGVAILMLSTAGITAGLGMTWIPVLSVFCALAGGLAAVAILFTFSSFLKSGLTLLIVGIMISYLCSSVISLLNYFSPAEEIRNYLVWGLGSFSGLRLSSAFWLVSLSVLSIIPSLSFIKPLNALLLGERYLESVGYSARNVRGGILLITGLLVAVPTAFCGPIGFIGLIVPHICRMLFRTSNHILLIPGCIIFGAVISLACALFCVLPSGTFGVLPINVITPLIGVPFILFLLVNGRRLPYFS